MKQHKVKWYFIVPTYFNLVLMFPNSHLHSSLCRHSCCIGSQHCQILQKQMCGLRKSSIAHCYCNNKLPWIFMALLTNNNQLLTTTFLRLACKSSLSTCIRWILSFSYYSHPISHNIFFQARLPLSNFNR